MVTFPAVQRTSADAPGFLDAIDRVAAGLVFRYRPPHVALIRVRGWFDHRWLRFSGIGRVFFDPPWPSHPGVSLHEHHQDRLTFPPFAPTRVAGEDHWVRKSDGRYAVDDDRLPIYRSLRQHSSANLQRCVADIAESALYVWFSSTSAHDRPGSVLVYVVNDGTTFPWFASLREAPIAWSLGDVSGLGRAEIAELLEHPPGVR